jgi:short-subunit dehydrogenase
MKLNQKTIWVTGATSGIGEALAIELAKRNNTLILSGRNIEKLKQLKNQLSAGASKVEILPFNLSEEKEIELAAEKVLNSYTHIDLLINNGGVSQRSLIHETDLEIDRKIMEINYFGNIFLAKKILPRMMEQGGGQIAVTTSIVGKFGFPLRSAYSASKHALYGFYETLRAELYEQHISVNMICPGRIRTNISMHAINKKGQEHGKMDEGQNTGMPADKCAKKIIRGLEKNKREILVGGKEIIMVHIKRYLPALFFKIARKIKPT